MIKEAGTNYINSVQETAEPGRQACSFAKKETYLTENGWLLYTMFC